MGNMSPRTAELYNEGLKSSRKNFRINNEVKDLINNYESGNIEQLEHILKIATKHNEMSYEYKVFRTFAVYDMIMNNESHKHDLGNKTSEIVDDFLKINNSILINRNSQSAVKRKKACIASEYAYKATRNEKYKISAHKLIDVSIDTDI